MRGGDYAVEAHQEMTELSMDHRYRDIFLCESYAHLQSFREHLIHLAENKEEQAELQEVFRNIHTIKGMAATMGFADMAHLTHEIEDALDLIRKGKRVITAELLELLTCSGVILGQMLDDIGSGGRGASDSGCAATLAAAVRSMCFGHRGQEETNQISVHRAVKLYGQDSDVLKEGFLHRRVPLHMLFNQCAQMISETARALGKEARLTIEGGDIELEYAQIAALTEPIIHLLRNALAHGIEFPHERIAKGKPRMGEIGIFAHCEGDHLFIILTDDGAGIDTAVIRRQAVEQGLLTYAQVQHLSEAQVLWLIALPGFTTASEVTELSGRGVGMDAIYKKITAISGQLAIETHLDRGVSFKIRLPYVADLVSA